MSSKTLLQQTNDFAPHYDEYIAQTHWHGSEMLFGLMYEYILSEENLLDLGIGTGLSSLPFKKLGLKIYGVDGSEEMIKICQKKAITEDIREADMVQFKSPYGVAVFDHVISHGVFHLIGELESVFHEVSRSIRDRGIFGFTIDEYKPENKDEYKPTPTEGVYSKVNEDSGILVYKHSSDYIKTLLSTFSLVLNKRTEFLAYRDEQSKREYCFSVFVVQKKA